MWVKSGTFTGLATDAWMFNYGVAIGTTTMANGVRLAVGTGVTISDTSVSATNFYGALTGTASTATRANTVDVASVSTNQNYNLLFSDGSGDSETLGVDADLLYNPSTNILTAPTINVGTLNAADGASSISLTSTTGDVGISSNLTVTGLSTFTGLGDFNGGINVIGHTELDDLNVSGVSTFTGQIDGNGGADISGGETTLSSATVSDLTSGRVVLAGTSGALEDSLNLTFDGTTLTVATTIDSTNLEVTNIKAKDGTSSITITDVTGNVGVSSNLTVNGNLYVLGSTTEVNTETLKVEDSLIEVGLVNSGGTLVAPVSDSNIDVGIIFHYYTSSAKKAGIYWDDSVSRVVVGSDLSETSSVITATTYAPVEVGALWVNDCAGQSQVISCTGSERFLENITIDCGSF